MIYGANQAVTPEEATIFETVEQALKAADRVMPKTKTWRTDAVKIRGETLVTIKHWPKGSTELCAERRWLKTGNKRKKKVEHGED